MAWPVEGLLHGAGLGAAVAWSKYDPRAPPADPLAPSSESGARRIWLLRWGWWISQAMFVLGLLLLLFWGVRRTA